MTDLQKLVADLLEAEFAPESAALPKRSAIDPVTEQRSVVLLMDGTKETVHEDRLRVFGFCVLVQPVVDWETRDQSGPAWIVDALLMVTVKINPVANSRKDGANIEVVGACKRAIQKITNAPRHPGGEFFKHKGRGGPAGELSQFDSAAWAYNLFFTKEAVL